MKWRTLSIAAAVWSAAAALAQTPGNPEDNGVTPTTPTFYINTPETILNLGNSTESIGIAISRNSNVIIGWENDGSGVTDLEAVWTLYSRDGIALTPETEQVSHSPEAVGTVTSRFLSFFNGTNATPGRTAWGPKIKANLFGDGVGMGATAFDLGVEVPALAPVQNAADGSNSGDFPAVQLLGNNGEPAAIVVGAPDAYTERDGDIRIGDWEYLSNGNVLVVGESRQREDLVSIYQGADAKTHAIFRIVTPTNSEVAAVQLGSAEATESQMWHGAASTKGGFALRFAGPDGRAKVRFFSNSGAPIGASTTNIDLGTLAGNEIMSKGGRGDGVGFHGNGNDSYVAVATGADADGKQHVWVTVMSTNGTVRWSKSASDDLTLSAPSRCDVAIDSLGRVAVAYADPVASANGSQALVLARVFDATGKPLGKTFRVSESELPEAPVGRSADPRVALRNDTLAVTWVSRNGGHFNLEENPKAGVVAARFFVIPIKPGSIESAGLKRITADTPVIVPEAAALGNWEPYVSVLGTSTFLIEGNTFADSTTDKQRYVVALAPAAGGAGKTVEGFYADDGTPFKGEINASRQNGNPGRVAGDPRPGATNYMVGGEASPHVYEPFNAGNRWNTGFDRLADGRYGTVQTYGLNTATLTPTPLHRALDAANGRLTSGAAAGNQITRFGGEIVCLENGNFAVLIEDRSRVLVPDSDATVCTIFKPDGTVVKDTFVVEKSQIWSNLAATKGGFVVRAAGRLFFYNNEGVLQGEPVDQNTSGESYDRGRGDGTRIAGHINSPYVFLAGKVSTAAIVRVAAWDVRTRAFVGVADVSEGGFRGDFDRATVAVDALSRVTVAWVAKPDGYEQQQVAARVLAMDETVTPKQIKPLTPSFLTFVNQAPVGGIRSFQMSLAMTTKEILIAAKGEINLQNKPELGANSPVELNFYTIVSHPDPKTDPLAVGADPVRITKIQAQGANLVLEWSGGSGPFKVQKRASLSTGVWTDAATRTERNATLPNDGTAGFFRIVQ